MRIDDNLRRLAELYGVQTTYRDVDEKVREASPASLLAVLQALGAPLTRIDQASEAFRATMEKRRRRLLEPVVVAWNGVIAGVPLHLPTSEASATADCELLLEDGERRAWKSEAVEVQAADQVGRGGPRFAARALPLPHPLPLGYHQLAVEVNGRRDECLIIAAPERAYEGEGADEQRPWGVFLPLYALRRDTKVRSGDLSDLEALLDWAGRQGAGYVATLPILAGDLAADPGPYAPSSQCWWNEFYLDVARIPEFSQVAEAQTLLKDLAGRLPPTNLAARRVDYAVETRFQNRILDMLAAAFFDGGSSERREAFEAYRRRNPDVDAYARFRAAQESQGADWRKWPPDLCRDPLGAGDTAERASRRHLFAQWNMEQQIERLATHAATAGMSWYLDLPLGSGPTGYDAWKHRDLFVTDAAAGAPPDAFFSKGQNWSLPPLNPHRLRESRYAYFIEILRWHMRHAGLLRLDHAMRFERLFWIPAGTDADQGVYVRYPVEEFFAILTLESQRSRTRLIGENLGTVSEAFNRRLDRHGIDGTYVLQFELEADEDRPIHPAPSSSAARLNTHDTPPFAAFFAELDIDDRLDLGLLNADEALRERGERRKLRRCLATYLHREGRLTEWTLDPELVLEALLAHLAAGPSRQVTVNLEDLWLETRPQNTPGTSTERPNWQRQTKYSLEAIRRHPAVLRMLRTVNELRRHPREQT